MDKHDDVVFMIHYNGVFKYDPLRYEQFRVVEACTIDRVMFSPLLDMLVAKLKNNIWALFLCILGLDIDNSGLKLIKNDANVHGLYDLTEKHVTVDLFVAHLPHNLANYYHQNLCLDGSDEEVTSKKKEHALRKKHVGNIFVKELVVWAEDEANYPYFRSPPLKSTPWLGMDGVTSDTIEETKPFHASFPAINHVITCKTCLKWSTCFVKEELYTKMSSKCHQKTPK
ncbi:hypothetical protein Tco_1420555 [Tanacetum coccineum]